LSEGGGQVDGVAEMEGFGTGLEHGIGAVAGVAAVVEDDEEVLILEFSRDLSDVAAGEFEAEVVVEEAGGGFSHDEAGGAGGFKGGAPVFEEIGAFLKEEVDGFGFEVAGGHDFGHVEESAG